MKIFVKAEESGGRDIKLLIPLFLASNRIVFSFIWGKAKVEITKQFPIEKQELYQIFKALLKEAKKYKGLELINVSKEGRTKVSIVI